MQVMQVIPWLDLFLGLLFFGLLAIGFWQGLLKEIWLLFSLYLAAVLASLYGDYVGGLIAGQVQRRAGITPAAELDAVASAWGFFIVIALGTVILFTIIHALTRHLRLKSSLLVLDKVGGALLGLATAFLLATFTAMVLDAALASGAGPQEWAFVGVLKAQRLTSPLLQLFLSTREVILAPIRPFLPAGLPYFLQA